MKAINDADPLPDFADLALEPCSSCGIPASYHPDEARNGEWICPTCRDESGR